MLALQNNSGLSSAVAVSKALPEIANQTERVCREKPSITFDAALAEGIKAGLPKK